MVHVDHVVQTAARLVPEALRERDLRPVGRVAPARLTRRRDTQRIDPQRLHLHRLADARRDLAPVDARVHPRELHARRTGGEQAVVVHADAEARAGRVAGHDRRDRVAQPRLVARVHGTA